MHKNEDMRNFVGGTLGMMVFQGTFVGISGMILPIGPVAALTTIAVVAYLSICGRDAPSPALKAGFATGSVLVSALHVVSGFLAPMLGVTLLLVWALVDYLQDTSVAEE